MSLTTTSPANFSLTPTDMNSAVRLAEMMSTGKLVPQHLQKSPGDCLMVIEQAMRWGMSPFAVAQATAIVRGKLSYEGKLVAAAVVTSGVLDGRLDYRYSGEGAARAVTCSGRLRGEAEPRTVDVRLADAKTDNEHWKKSPDQMLSYHAARVWARRHTPEVMLGVYSPEEFDTQQQSAKPADTFKGPTLDAEPSQDAGLEYPFQTRQGVRLFATAAEWLDAWRKLVRNCLAADAPDKLRAAQELNRGAFQAVRDFEARAVLDVEAMLADALAPVSDEPGSREPSEADAQEGA